MADSDVVRHMSSRLVSIQGVELACKISCGVLTVSQMHLLLVCWLLQTNTALSHASNEH